MVGLCNHENLVSNFELFQKTGNDRLLIFLNNGKIHAEIYTCLDCGELVGKQVGGNPNGYVNKE